MMVSHVILAVACWTGCLWGNVRGHGRLIDPPNRSSLFRFVDTNPLIAPYKDRVVPNYNDNQLFCGGSQYQKNLGGKCGICGDPYDKVRENEAGGKYARGIIVAQYDPGSWIEVQVQITADHKGYFEFRLCPWNNPTVPATKQCLDSFLLQNDKNESPKWNLPEGGGYQTHTVFLKLPDEVVCDQCVMQWRYHTGNSYGCDDDGTCCVGCGHQEEFYGCADVAIGTGEILPPPPTDAFTSVATGSTTASTAPPPYTTTTSPGPDGTICTCTTPPTSTTATTTVTTTSTTNNVGIGENPCAGGKSTVKVTCTTFSMCYGDVLGSDVLSCSSGTVFNELNGVCDHMYNVSPPCGTLGK